MAACFMLVSGLLFLTGGCRGLPRLSLSLFYGSPPMYLSTLVCNLYLNRTGLQFHTFTLSLNGNLVQLFRRNEQKVLYYLDKNKNYNGLWRCKVDEYPGLIAEYYLGPPTSVPPAEKDRDTDEEATSVPYYTASYRIILTLIAAVSLLIVVIIVTGVTSSRCSKGQSRNTSAPQPDADRRTSDHFLLAENFNSNPSDPNGTSDTVSYVELERITTSTSRKFPNPHCTIYATIV